MLLKRTASGIGCRGYDFIEHPAIWFTRSVCYGLVASRSEANWRILKRRDTSHESSPCWIDDQIQSLQCGLKIRVVYREI